MPGYCHWLTIQSSLNSCLRMKGRVLVSEGITIPLVNYSRIDFDKDNDGIPDAIDSCPNDFNPGGARSTLNSDGDTCRCIDNCPYVANNDQKDDDDNGIGNECEKYKCKCSRWFDHHFGSPPMGHHLFQK